MTTITPDMTLQEAKEARDRELAQALIDYEARAAAINAAFASRLLDATAHSSVTKVARDLGMNRQNVHRIIRAGTAAA